MNLNDPLLQIIKRLDALETEQRRLASLEPLFPIWNLAEQEALTADQTNYALRDYGIIQLVPTANRIIRGITNGYRGRILFLRNDNASFTITLNNQDAAAVAENRIVTPSNANVVLGTRQTAIFFYRVASTTTSRWMLEYPIA